MVVIHVYRTLDGDAKTLCGMGAYSSTDKWEGDTIQGLKNIPLHPSERICKKCEKSTAYPLLVLSVL